MTETPPRDLYFHTGAWKTGSTALQAYLEGNQVRLGDAGVSYEFHPRTDHFGGNGRYLAEQLFGRHLAPDILDRILEDYLAGRITAVCSCDTFAQFTKSEWQQVVDACARLRIRPRTITYVRNIAPYYRSLHAQLFKSGSHCCTLDDFAKVDCYRLVITSLTCLHELVGRDAMTVVHYESTMNDIDAPLLAALGLPSDGFDRSMLARMWNRSLTQYEMDILRELIEKTGVQLASRLATLLLEKRPTLKPDLPSDVEFSERLKPRHSGDITWLNKVFFNGANVVTIAPDKRPTDPHEPLSADDKQAIDRDVAAWCILQLEAAQAAGVTFIADRLARIDWKNVGHALLPADFDPIAYLLINRDILKSDARPCEHYIAHGRHELGRRWKW